MLETKPAKDHKMITFIQTFYGTVLGVGSIAVFAEGNKASLSPCCTWTIMDIPLTTCIITTLIQYLITIFIVAHHWFTFHSENRKRDDFSSYVFEILSMFFLAQMVYFSTQGYLLAWFIVGVPYTGCNILDQFITKDRKEWKKEWWNKYIWHVIICAAGIVTTWLSDYKFWYYALIQFILISALVVMWGSESKRNNKKPVETGMTQPNGE